MEDWNEKGTKDFTETRSKRKYHRITDTQRYAVLPSQALDVLRHAGAAGFILLPVLLPRHAGRGDCV